LEYVQSFPYTDAHGLSKEKPEADLSVRDCNMATVSVVCRDRFNNRNMQSEFSLAASVALQTRTPSQSNDIEIVSAAGKNPQTVYSAFGESKFGRRS
jgi:hypothetical protein